MTSRLAAFLILVLTSLVSVTALADERKEVAERADCVITVGDRVGVTDLVIADCQWPIAASTIIPVIKDAGIHHQVMSSVVRSDKVSDLLFHQVHQASGISDREVTLKFTVQTYADGVKVSWTRAAAQQPMTDEDNVQAVQDDGYWEVRDNGDGTSHVFYGLRYDPGGRVPSWVVRAFQKSGIADIVEEMREYCEKK
jgi:hypothetical protein